MSLKSLKICRFAVCKSFFVKTFVDMFEAVEYLFPFGHSLADWGSKSQND